MNTIETKQLPEKAAKIISVIFHPLFMPVYAMIIIFSAPTLLGYLPFQVKRLLFLIVLVNNVLLPVSLLPFLKHWKIVSSWTIDTRRERVIPLVMTTILYSITAFMIYGFPVPVFLKSFILATFFVSLLVTVINFWWKISLHSAGAGALIAIVFILSFKMYSPLVWYLISSVVAGGLVLSSRLRLNFHNPQQVWFGFLSGFLGLILFMMFF
jgi:membrane-associated phospholipid phosphatase